MCAAPAAPLTSASDASNASPTSDVSNASPASPASDAVRYRPLVRGDLDAVVRAFDDMWGNWGPTAGAPESMLLSRHFVLHYLEASTHGEIAERGDGTFLGVTLSRIVGRPVLFDDVPARLAATDAELDATPLGASGLRSTLRWHAVEIDMEREIGINDDAQAEVELFLVAAQARGRGVGGTLWRHALARFAAAGVRRYYLHTDSGCDVGFYRHKGLDCVAERYGRDHPEDRGPDGTAMDDLFIYAGTVTPAAGTAPAGNTSEPGA